MFSKSGSFKSASSALTDKATNAMFSLIKNLYRYRSLNPRIMLDLFDKMVVPIALYGVEVWGVNFVPVNKKNNDCFILVIFPWPELESPPTQQWHNRYRILNCK